MALVPLDWGVSTTTTDGSHPAAQGAWSAFTSAFAQGQPIHLPAWGVALIVAAALVLSVPRVTWRWFGLFVTVVHELGHAFAALMTGRLVTGITIRHDHSGATHMFGRPGLGALWAGFWGYPAPAVTGLVLVAAAAGGWSHAALMVGTAVIVATLLFIRNAFGLLVVLASAAVSWLLGQYASAEVVGWVTLVLGVALLVGSVRDLVNVVGLHFTRRELLATSDAYLLWRQSIVPSPVWLLGFASVIGPCALTAFSLVTAL